MCVIMCGAVCVRYGHGIALLNVASQNDRAEPSAFWLESESLEGREQDSEIDTSACSFNFRRAFARRDLCLLWVQRRRGTDAQSRLRCIHVFDERISTIHIISAFRSAECVYTYIHFL